MSITIKDVATLAGVSTSTVSKVLNNWSTISQPTVSRVQDAIVKLNYTPNTRAVNFAKQTTNNIIYLTSLGKDEAYKNPHMFDIMCGVGSELAKTNYSLQVVDTSKDTVPGSSVKDVIARRLADGMVIHGSAINKETADLIINQQFPHIIIGRPDFDNQLCWIDTNHALAGRYAANHMLECNYTKVAFIGGKKKDYISYQRQKGFISGMYDYGYSIPESMIGYTDSSVEASYLTALDFLAAEKKPQAIVCENSMIAVGVVKAIKEANLRLPEDIGLLTFDTYPYSQIIDPKPTVIDINVFDMGVQAALIMMNKLHNPSLQIQSFVTLPVLNQGITTRK